MAKKTIRINENTLRNIVHKSVRKLLNEHTFFIHNDPVFPEELCDQMWDIAEEYGLQFDIKRDYVKMSTQFCDGFQWYTASEIFGVKDNGDGTLNYWNCSIGPSGRQHNSGPGFPDTAVHGQTPVTPEQYLKIVRNHAEQLARMGR